MEFVQAHLADFLALYAALAIAARIIVRLTPTPKDDKALQNVASWLKMIKVIFGQDLKEGKTTTTTVGGSKGKTTACLLFALLFVLGCTPAFQDNPRAKLLIAQKSFASVVETLTVMKQLDKLDEDDIQKIDVLIHEGQIYLESWYVAVIDGKDKPGVELQINRILQQLIEYEIRQGDGE